MTSLSIVEIIEYERLIGNLNEELTSLDVITQETIEIIKTHSNKTSELFLPKLVDNFTNIRNNIKELRNSVYANNSSNPAEVINNLITNYENIFTENSISIENKKLFPQDKPVLIKSYELGNILDNLFQNSVRFMQNSETKKITIEIYKESPKIIIKFSNTGSVISEDKWKIIFEQGYSEGGSTGQGLFSAQEILKKYGGRIYVSNSNLELTTFKIELNEGVITV
jgi:signal transduction histidine kinase